MKFRDKKAVVIGIDGATFEKIIPYAKKGHLPTFKKLINKRLGGILKTPLPPTSPMGWSTLYTGVNPVNHGIFDFVKRKKNSYFVEPIFSSDRKTSSFWEYLSRKNLKTVGVALPFTYPVKPFSGMLVSGFGVPSMESDFTFPEDLKEKILKKFPNFCFDFSEHTFSNEKNKQIIKSKVFEITREQHKVAKWLFKNQEWNVFFFVLRSIDVIQHFFWDEEETLIKFYKQVDSILSWYIKNLNNSVLIICSDHGFHDVHNDFYVNNWLEKEGLIKFMNNKKSHLDFAPSAETIQSVLIKSGARRLVGFLKTFPITEHLLKFLIKSEMYDFLFRLDWKKTKAYYLGTTNSLIFLNIKGREASGIVSMKDKDKLSKDIARRAMSFVYEGTNPIKSAFTAKELYGAYPKEGPDVVLVPQKGFSTRGGYNKNGEIVSSKAKYKGDHDEDGIFFIVGSKKKFSKEASAWDICPTILNIFDIKAESLEGKSII